MARGETHDIIYGLKDGQIVHIENAIRGLKCDCICPGCEGRLEACRGERKRHYFRHADREDCGYSFESALHYFAKEIIGEEGKCKIPTIKFRISGYPSHYHRRWLSRLERADDAPLPEPFCNLRDQFGYTKTRDKELYGGRVIHLVSHHLMEHWWHPGQRKFVLPYEQVQIPKIVGFDEIKIERSQGSFKPDLLCKIGGHTIYIEIAVTHFVDADKKGKMEQRENTSLLEIDLSKVPRESSKDKLRELLIGGEYRSKNVEWKYNHVYENRQRRLEAFCMNLINSVESEEVVDRLIHPSGEVQGCPIKLRGNEPVTAEMCRSCDHCLGFYEAETVWETANPDCYVRCIGHRAQSLRGEMKRFIADNSDWVMAERFKSIS